LSIDAVRGERWLRRGKGVSPCMDLPAATRGIARLIAGSGPFD
jgi:hypothetical protein